jgi:hypothetical protein
MESDKRKPVSGAVTGRFQIGSADDCAELVLVVESLDEPASHVMVRRRVRAHAADGHELDLFRVKIPMMLRFLATVAAMASAGDQADGHVKGDVALQPPEKPAASLLAHIESGTVDIKASSGDQAVRGGSAAAVDEDAEDGKALDSSTAVTLTMPASSAHQVFTAVRSAIEAVAAGVG